MPENTITAAPGQTKALTAALLDSRHASRKV